MGLAVPSQFQTGKFPAVEESNMLLQVSKPPIQNKIQDKVMPQV
jgi:hypothetical protein